MTHPRYRLASAFAVLGACLLSACAVGQSSPRTATPSAAASTVRVVTSIDVFADITRNVAGDRANVTALVPSGADVHTVQLTPRDIQAIGAAAVIVINGSGLEAAVERAVRTNARAGARVVELFASVPETERIQGGGDEDGGASGTNPHAWLDPRLGQRYVDAIRDALAAADPDGRATYEANARRYAGEIQDVDRQNEQGLQSIPERNRKLVTLHDAFPYLARRYGLDLAGVVVESPENEPSAATIAALSARIRDQHVPAVYTEPQINARILEQVARDAGVRVLPLYSDSLDARVSTYLDLLRFNTQQLAAGLGSA